MDRCSGGRKWRESAQNLDELGSMVALGLKKPIQRHQPDNRVDAEIGVVDVGAGNV